MKNAWFNLFMFVGFLAVLYLSALTAHLYYEMGNVSGTVIWFAIAVFQALVALRWGMRLYALIRTSRAPRIHSVLDQ